MVPGQATNVVDRDVLKVSTATKGPCTLSAKKLKAGTYSLVATYGGSTNFEGSTSAKEALTVAE